MTSRDRRTSFDRIQPNNEVEGDQSDDEVPSNDEESRGSPPATPERAHINEAFESDEPQPLDPAPTSEEDGQHQEAGPSRRRSSIDEADVGSILTQRGGSNPETLQSDANLAPSRRIQPAEEPPRQFQLVEFQPPRRFQPAELQPSRREAAGELPPPGYDELDRFAKDPPSYESVAGRQIDPRQTRAPRDQQTAEDIIVDVPAAAPQRPVRLTGRQLELYPTQTQPRSASSTGGRKAQIMVLMVILALLGLLFAGVYAIISRQSTTE